MPPSHVESLPPLKGVVPPSGKVIVSAPLSVVEDDYRIVELTHFLQLLHHVADVVVHLLHAGFVDAPVLAAGLADHRTVLVIQHGRDVHRAGLYQTKKGLLVFFGIVAVQEVDHLG
jgi:hypothetical protein